MATPEARGRTGRPDAQTRSWKDSGPTPPGRIAARARGATMIVALTVSTLGRSAAAWSVADVAAATGACGSGGTFAESPLRCVYTSTGVDSFTVPQHVSQVTFDVYGAAGGGVGSEVYENPKGGRGGEATATLGATPGQVFQVDVAQKGGPGQGILDADWHPYPNRGAGSPGTGGANGDSSGGSGGQSGYGAGTLGGGGGGGASDIRAGSCTSSLQCGLADRIIVAGGGGGSTRNEGYGSHDSVGGGGGGTTGDNGSDGGPGNFLWPGYPGTLGSGGTATESGVGGIGGEGSGTAGFDGYPFIHTSWAVGGSGGRGGNPVSWTDGFSWVGESGYGGGGGGGGYFGGGGGGGGGGSGFDSAAGGGGSGGGGSGYVTPTAVSGSMANGVQEGNGKVVVSWKVDPTISVPHSDGVTVGQNLKASVSLANGYKASGTVTFKVFGPTDTACSSPLATLSGTVSGDAATSAAYVPTSVGTYSWTASYGGDTNNNAAGPTECGAPGSTVVVTPAVPTVWSYTSPVSNPITGTTYTENAVLASGYQPTGSITFALYDNNACSGDPVMTAGPVSVNGNGIYSSGNLVAPAPGTYYWVATYGGDASNESAAGGCGANQIYVRQLPAPAFTFDLSTLPAQTYGGAGFDATHYVSTNSTGAVTFALGEGSVGCTVTAGGSVTLIAAAAGASRCILEASIAATGNYTAAGPISQSFNIAVAAPAFTNVVIGSGTYDGMQHAATADVTGLDSVDLGDAGVIYQLRTGAFPNYSYGTPTATPPTDAGTYRVTFTYDGSANYASAAENSHVLTIGKADQSITFDALPDRTYGDPAFTVSATADSGLPVVFATVGTCGLSGTTVHLTGAGSCTVLASQVGDTNYNAARSVTQTFTIAKAAQAISFAALPAKTYSDADFTVAATTSSGLTVAFSADGACSITTTSVHLTAAGSCTITASQAGNANYDPAPSVSRMFAIGKASLSVTADAVSSTVDVDHFTRAYGSANPPFTARYVGFVNGDDVTDLLGTLSFATDAVTTSPVGAYTVTLAGLDSANYDVTFIAGTLDVGKADQSITFDALPDRTYGDPAFTVSATADSGLPVVFATVGTCGLSGTTVHLTGAGSCTVLASQVGDTNYNAARSVTQTFTIAKADPTISVTGYSVTYDGGSHTATGTATGVSGEPLSGLDLGATTHTDAGSYSDGWTFTDPNGNYNSTSGTVSDSVTKVALMITPETGQKMIYGSAPAANLAWTLSGFVNGETDSGLRAAGALSGAASCSAGVSDTSSVATYPITCTAGSLSASNYSFAPSSQTVTFAVTPATLTVTAHDKSVQYSDPLPGLSYTIAGFVNGETLATSGVAGRPSLGTTATLSSGNVVSGPGTYAITAAKGSLSATNYTFTYVSGTLHVDQEDARATYAGNALFWAGSTGASSATVTLTATIRDISAISDDPAYDAYPGAITHANVAFINRDTNVTLCTANVALVSSADPTVGTASCTTTLTIGSSGATQYTIGTVVSGRYTDDSSTENAVIDVAQPLGSYFITGGGFVVESASAGQYAADPGTKSNFGFNVKFNKGATNLQGNVNIIFRKGGHTYQVKSTALTSLAGTPSPCAKATSASPCKANFASKANLHDITSPDAPVSLGGNLTFQMSMTDYGDPTKDTIGITLYSGSGLLFSSNWSGTKTVEQILGGGNIAVR